MENLVDEIEQQGALYSRLSKCGTKVVQNLDEDSDKEELLKRLDDINNGLKEVKEQVEKRKKKINEVYPLALDFKTNVDDFTPWLVNTERIVGEIKPGSVKKADANTELNKLKV